MAKKKPKTPKARVEFQAPTEWVERAERIAERAGFTTLAAYIRSTLTSDMDRRESVWASAPKPDDAGA